MLSSGYARLLEGRSPSLSPDCLSAMRLSVSLLLCAGATGRFHHAASSATHHRVPVLCEQSADRSGSGVRLAPGCHTTATDHSNSHLGLRITGTLMVVFLGSPFHATVDTDDLAGHIPRFRACEKANNTGNVFDLCEAIERNPLFEVLFDVIGNSLEHIRFDESRRNTVGRRTRASHLQGERAGEAEQTALG